MGRKCYFRNRLFVCCVPAFLMMVIVGCTKPQIQFSNAYNGDNATNVVSVDTFSVKLSTVFLDSFTTSGTKSQLLGRYNDPFFGTVTSRSYSDIGAPYPLPSLTNFSVYDSIQLILRINKTFYGDTSKIQGFLVSQLTQVMNYPGIQTAFYSNNSIPYDPAVLGSAYVQINPTAGLTSQRMGDSVKITMPNSMGEQLFGLLYRQPDTITNASLFRGYFKGLTVYPDTTLPGAVYGFMDSLVLRLFYHEPGVVMVQKTADFPLVNPATQFNQIIADRTGTPTAPLGPGNLELPSTATGNQAFLQPITSLYTKLLFPTITDLLGYPDYLAVMKAQLIIKPVQGTYSPVLNLPPAVNLTLTNYANTIGAVLPYGSGNLTIDYLYGTNTNYTYDITAYIQKALTQGAPNNAINGLMLITPATTFNTTFNRAVFGDSHNPQLSNQISLKIYYASYY
ncbi:MAG TPA: hypothetical protein DIC22_12785 [Chitinophagaceae bacterium]|jgi:hypothetical protein|nr:hypothetical protein [Chitinophagaceae bacterium]